MMRRSRRLFCPLLAAAVLAATLGGVPPPAAAAIRIVISDGVNTANDQVFYNSSNSVGSAITTTFDGYSLLVSTTSSNFSGTSAEGFLSQSVLVSGNGIGPLAQLQVSTAVIAPVGSLADGQVLNPTDAANVKSSALLQFTLPSNPALQVTSRVNSLGATDTGATVQLATVVNGGPPVTSLTTVDGTVNQTTGTATGLPGYTLASTLTLSGASPGVQGLQLFGRSSVTALTPEPSVVLVWGLGALGLVFAARRRLMPTTA